MFYILGIPGNTCFCSHGTFLVLNANNGLKLHCCLSVGSPLACILTNTKINTKTENTGTKSTRRTRKKTGKSPSTVIVSTKIPRKRNTKTRRKPNTKMAAQRNTKTNTKIKTRRRERKRRWVSPVGETRGWVCLTVLNSTNSVG
uniref:Uncharacterized protein n=1 Tax=Cyanistes caeruleus TaxID=156563 RepID=A0A8C0UBY6_CYACU